MEVYRGSWSGFTDIKDSVITVGFFDGVHLGHRAILDHVTGAAKAQGLRSVVLTFAQHPREVLVADETRIPRLTTPEEKLALLRDAGVDLALVVQFDHGLSQMSANDFVQIILKGRIGMRKIVVGFNHGFGKQRLGDRETLIALSKNLGFSVDVVNPTRVGDAIVSSTGIRELIADGNVASAAERLGRHYSVKGVVIHGVGRGRRLGFPTANIGVIASGKLCPKDGIYAGLAHVRGETFAAAISSGFNPTFTEGKHSVEAHLLDFDRDIYDESLELRFVEKLRSPKKFESEQELKIQIADDVHSVLQLIQERGVMRNVS
ncbi:bifunctional riboflavin kinase/FAD synthetase [candidate division KSB1 bacterium]|nr:MAG: bifunctional riboflavin kinase/FAD synthetase [candidate division KSB1 bacterium]